MYCIEMAIVILKNTLSILIKCLPMILRKTLSIEIDYFDRYTEYFNEMVVLSLTNTLSISNDMAIVSPINT